MGGKRHRRESRWEVPTENPFRRSLDASRYPMWIYDRDSLQFLQVNDTAVAHYGYSREEFLGLALRDIWVETTATEFDPTADAPEGPEAARVRIRRHRTRDGRIIEADVVAVDLEDGSVLEIPRDVTELMDAARSGELLLESERRARVEAERGRARFRALFEGSPGLFLVLEPSDYRIVEVSDAYLRATMTTREIIGQRLFDVFPDDPEDPAATGVRNLRASLERVAERRRVDAMALQRYPLPRPASLGGGFEERFWSVINAPVIDETGSLALIIHRVEDVTMYIRMLEAGGEPVDPARLDRPALAMAAEVLTRADEIQELNRYLEERDRLLAIAGRVARIGGWMVDLATETVHWSDEVCVLHDVPPGTSHNLAEAIDYYVPEYRPTIRERFTECATRGTPYDLELELESARGRRMWVRAIGEAVRDEDGRIVRVQGAFQDISAWKATQAEVTRLANRLSSALDSMTDAFFTLDREWRFTHLNRQAESLLQRPRSQLLAKVVWDAFPEARESEFEVEYRRAVETGEATSFEAFYAPLAAWFDVRAFPSREGLTVYFRDATAEHETQEKLIEQASLLDQARDAIIVKTLDGRISYCNRGAERLYRVEALGGLTGAYLGELDYGPVLPAEVKAHVVERGEWNGELEQHRADGSTITVQSHLTLVRDRQGAPSRILAINTDITEQKKLQSVLLRTQRLESIGTLAGGIAHDLNNVLTPIIMATSLLTEDAADPDTLDTLRTIEQSANHGAALVRQVLAFARGVDGARVSIDLDRVVKDIGRIVREAFPKNIELRTRVPEGLWPLAGDPTQVHQVLLNLCVNARDAMPDGGAITIAAENVRIDQTYAALSPAASPGPHVRMVVEDTGSGIPAAVLDRVFDPFFSTKPVGEGTGLGLSTVASIVRGFGGYVTVYSEPGHGSSFHIYLPSSAATASDANGAATPDPTALPCGSGELILVVDDEESVRTITRLTLATYGYRVLTAVDGADALATYARRGAEIDVVLTDMRMPVMDGAATIHALRRIDPDVRIIAASGLDAGWADRPSTESGIRRFLEKPYTAAQLLEGVHAVLSEGA